MEETPTPEVVPPAGQDESPSGSAEGVSAEPAPVEPAAERAFDALGQPIPASSFAPSLDEEARTFGSPRPLVTLCMWCNQPLPDASAETCPHCGAALKPVDEDIAIPGLTVSPVDPRAAMAATSEQLAAYAVRTPESIAPEVERPELEPPSLEVRRKMLEMQLEALGVSPTDAAAAVGDDVATSEAAGGTDAAVRPAGTASTPESSAVPSDGEGQASGPSAS